MRLMLGKAPVVVAAVVVTLANFAVLAARVAHPNPNTPWESGHIVDGWRAANGLAIYEEPSAGHATTMYGPALAFTLGAIFRVTGANNYAGRVFQLLCGLGAAALLAHVLTRGQTRLVKVLAWTLLFGVNLRTADYFSDTRPDAACLLFSALAVVLAYRAGWASFAAGLAALVVAFCFKQTAVVAACVVALGYACERRRAAHSWVKAALALAVLPAAVLVTKLFLPLVYHYMIVVPAQNPVELGRLAGTALWTLASVPVFFVALFEFLLGGGRPGRLGLWLLAALPVTFAYGLISAARVGGSVNSLMPAYAALFCFTAWRLPRVLAWLDGARRGSTRRAALGIAFALAFGATLLADFGGCVWMVENTHGDGRYRRAVEVARELPGKVVCPNDPTIPLYAKNYAGRQVFMELDAAGLFGDVPGYVLAEVASADYVIQVNKVFAPQLLPDARLASMGLRPVAQPALEGSAYTVWTKTATAGGGRAR
jgi:hypothetical protein